MNESVDRRILGAFRCVDSVTGNVVAEPSLLISNPQWSIKPNLSGTYVIFDGPGFNMLTTQFVPTTNPWPSAVSFEVTIVDPALRYLPRCASVNAPLAVPSLFSPQTINVFPSPAAPTAPNWSIIHASVINSATSQGLPWAVLQITRTSDNTVIGSGATDSRGEALLAVPGLKGQIGQSPSGPVFQPTLPVTVAAWFDPSVLAQPAGWIPDPDAIFQNLTKTNNFKSATQAAELGVGQDLTMSLAITL
ncbi:MAG: hypothetical protein WCC84_07110 [Candidatus Cybelea sp.]